MKTFKQFVEDMQNQQRDMQINNLLLKTTIDPKKKNVLNKALDIKKKNPQTAIDIAVDVAKLQDRI